MTPATDCDRLFSHRETKAYGVARRVAHDGDGPRSGSGHFHLPLPERDAIGVRTLGADGIPELPRGRSLKSAWESTAGQQTIDCSLLQSAMLALLPCLGQVAETVSDECCKGEFIFYFRMGN